MLVHDETAAGTPLRHDVRLLDRQPVIQRSITGRAAALRNTL